MKEKNALRTLSYALIIILLLTIVLTNFGNYFHGGTAMEGYILTFLMGINVLLFFKLFILVKYKEKVLIIILGILPLLGVITPWYFLIKRWITFD